jgi:hypothetical protein
VGVVLAWSNAAEAAGVSLSASSEALGLGIGSVLERTIGNVWRSGVGGAVSHVLATTLPAVVPVRVVAIAAPRDGVLPGAGATWRVQASAVEAGAAEAFDSGVQALGMRRGVAAQLLPAGVSARYVTVTVTCAAGDPYLQLGRLWIGDALVTERNPSYGWQRGVLDAGRSDRAAISGVRNVERGARARTLDFEIAMLTEAEAAAVDEAALAVGTTEQVFIDPIAGEGFSMFGHFTQPLAPAQPNFAERTVRITFEEDL